MEVFLKFVSGILISVILGLILSKNGKDMALLLSLAVCCMVVLGSAHYLTSIVDFFIRLQAMGNLNGQLVGVILKATGISLLTEVTAGICADAGNAAVGKALRLLASAVILWLSLPLLEELLTLLDTILGAI